jgi:hypothetical protein
MNALKTNVGLARRGQDNVSSNLAAMLEFWRTQEVLDSLFPYKAK